MPEPQIEQGTALRGLDINSRQMVIDTVRQLRNRLLTREKILEYDKKEIFHGSANDCATDGPYQ